MWNDLIISHNHFFLCWNDHCSLADPVLDLFRRQLEHIDAERNALRLKCNSRDVELSEKVIISLNVMLHTLSQCLGKKFMAYLLLIFF
jgi:hypothetical protein